MGSLLGVSESASAEFSFFYTKRSSFDLYIQTYRELTQHHSSGSLAANPKRIVGYGMMGSAQRRREPQERLLLWPRGLDENGYRANGPVVRTPYHV
jgi:hypothetical protein